MKSSTSETGLSHSSTREQALTSAIKFPQCVLRAFVQLGYLHWLFKVLNNCVLECIIISSYVRARKGKPCNKKLTNILCIYMDILYLYVCIVFVLLRRDLDSHWLIVASMCMRPRSHWAPDRILPSVAFIILDGSCSSSNPVRFVAV